MRSVPKLPSTFAPITVRGLLVRLVGLALIPLVLASGWNLYTRYREMRQRVGEDRLQMAELWGQAVAISLEDLASSAWYGIPARSRTDTGEAAAQFLCTEPAVLAVVSRGGGSSVTVGAPPAAPPSLQSGGASSAQPPERGSTGWEWAVSSPVLDELGNGYFWLWVHDRQNPDSQIILAIDVKRALQPIVDRISDSGEVNFYLADSHGMGFFSSLGPLPPDRRDISSHPHVKQVLATGQGAISLGHRSVQHDGVLKMGAGTPVPGTPWIAISTEPVATAMATANRAAWMMLAALGISLLVAIGLAFLADRLIGRRIQGLILAILALGQGEADYRLPAHRADGFGDVEQAFNHAAEQLESRQRENAALLLETQRREADFRETSQFLRAILENAPAGILVLRGGEHRLAFASEAHYRYLGRAARPDAIGESILPHLTSDPALTELAAALEEVQAHGVPYQKANVQLKAMPGRFWSYLLQPLPPNLEGEAGVLVVYHEITEVVDAQHLAQLRLKELELILGASADPTAVLTLNGRVQVANSEARRLGIPSEGSTLSFAAWAQHLQLTRGDGSAYTPEDSIFARAARGEAVYDELQRRREADGEKFWLASAVPVGEGDRLEKIIFFAKDVTDLKELEQAKDVFLSIASHELKTPLTAMGGYVELAVRSLERLTANPAHEGCEVWEGQAQPGIAKSLERLRLAHNAMRRLAGLVDDLLDVSRLQMGRFPMQKEPTEIGHLLSGIVERWQTTTDRHTLILEAPGSLWTDADPSRLEQVFNNLVSNAIKYSPDGGWVRLSARLEGDQVRIAISDQGLGISRDSLERIFDPFYRARLEPNTPGLGLGLFVCKQIVDRHGGTVEVQSRPGSGSTFTVRIPAVLTTEDLPVSGSSGQG